MRKIYQDVLFLHDDDSKNRIISIGWSRYKFFHGNFRNSQVTYAKFVLHLVPYNVQIITEVLQFLTNVYVYIGNT